MKTLLVIFGITGDLSTRKLLPAISHIVEDNEGIDVSVLGVSRREVDVQDIVMSSTNDQVVANLTKLHTMDLSTAADYAGLKEAIDAYKADQTLLYLSVPPGAAANMVELLGEAGLNTPNIRLMLEKPFGSDLVSAKDFLHQITKHFTEEQVYRIDHYMAKEVSAEVIRLRRDAEKRLHSWGKETVESVEIVATESIDIEGRADFYEQTGALRDFIQGHLMQQLSLVLLDAAEDFEDEQIPELRLAALNQLNVVQAKDSVRAQYKGYTEEVENSDSQTETFVSINLSSTDDNWRGVPLTLTSGKALDVKRSYIAVHHKDGTTNVFEEGKLENTDGHRVLDAYEKVILEGIAGRKTIFTSGAEVVRSWEILNEVQASWATGDPTLKQYAKGASAKSVTQS